MNLITARQRSLLLDNGKSLDSLLDRPPLVKLFTPDAAGTWLISAIDPESPDLAWGLCDPGLGTPELGWVSLTELASVTGRFRLPVCRDEFFRPRATLRAYVREAQEAGVILA